MGELDQEGRDELHYAARDNDVDQVRARLAAGVDVNLTERAAACSPLHFAVDNGGVETAEVLLDAGADIEARARRGLTPLHLAVERRRQRPDGAVIKLLVERGADKTARDVLGLTPADKAEAQRKFPTVLREILRP